FSVAVTPAYNLLAKSVDGEVGVDWNRGRVTLEAAGRAVSRELGAPGARQVALAGGFVARLTRYIAVSGDLGSFVAPVDGRAARVRVGTYRFATDAIVGSAGQAVRWVNGDPVEHTVTFDGGEPGSPLISPNGTWAHRFDRPGRYAYHCTPHPFMTGVVVVR